MTPGATYPAELAGLDLHEVWTRAAPLADCFDPFRFDHRMAAYRLLIESINRDGRFGADNRRNPLWGLMFQHQWQFRTGRLGPGTTGDGRIDPDSPWGYGNYALCVLPWLGAVAAGVVPDLTVAPPPRDSRFRYASGGGGQPLRVPAEFQPGVEGWKAFFLRVEGTPPGEDQEPLRLALWKAHKTCLDVIAERVTGIDPGPYSTLELTFLRGWCRMVDYLWVAAWPTDFDFMTTHGLDVLPERLLAGDDRQALAGLPDRVRGNLRAVLGLARLPAWRYGLNLALWKRVMRTRAARDEVVPMLDAVFSPDPDPAARRRMLRYLLRP